MGKIVTVQGLQYGSEAKGSIASMIAATWKPTAVASAWHPNAGHTAYIDGRKFVHSMLPLGALHQSVRAILLGPGSVIDTTCLVHEMQNAGELLYDKTIVIHPNAALLTPFDVDGEKALMKIGSTMKGSAHAYIRKMMRGVWYPDVPATIGTWEARHEWLHEVDKQLGYSSTLIISEAAYDYHLDSKRLLLEGAQGYGLGVHQVAFYPHTTSRDVGTAQLLADCRVPFQPVTTIGVLRTYPIRVANRFADGIQIGTSGPSYPGQTELGWKEDLGREPELTTVTKLPRRIFQFSMQQIKDACRMMQPTFLALTFCDYLGDTIRVPGKSGAYLPARASALIQQLQDATGIQVRFATTSPTDVWQVTQADTGLVHPVSEVSL